MGKSIILIHGRSQQGRDPAEIKNEWIAALRIGLGETADKFLAETEIALPFYGDALDAFTKEMESDLPPDVILRGATSDIEPEFRRFAAEVAERVKFELKISDGQIDAELAPGPIERGPENWEWVQALFRAADKLPGVSAKAIDRLTRDVYLYLTRNKVRNMINSIVSSAFVGGPAIVVGHSLGSVVGYDILRKSNVASNVTDYITVGSPLAVGPIMRSFMPLEYPSGLRSWYNAFDERDVVALNALDDTYFPIGAGKVQNYGKVQNRTENSHGISGYLCDPILAERIRAAVTT